MDDGKVLDDYALALRLQQEECQTTDASYASFVSESNSKHNDGHGPGTSSIVDESWELVDPNPDARQLFLAYDEKYFWGKLAGVEVRWSPRMTLCAGLCCYEGRGGLCSIRLSQPLLKLRPRRDLVQTLLHEMIHAYLFVTRNNKDHDAHGPEFLKHMARINESAGTNITVYHNFHDEVQEHRKHWWRCNGPCRSRPPYFGFVKRAMNRPPHPRDTWWPDHQRSCGGVYTKVKEPEGYGAKTGKRKKEHDEAADGSASHQPSKKVLTLDQLWKKTDAKSRNIEASTDDSVTKLKTTDSGSLFPGCGHLLGSSTSSSTTAAAASNSIGMAERILSRPGGTGANWKLDTNSKQSKTGVAGIRNQQAKGSDSSSSSNSSSSLISGAQSRNAGVSSHEHVRKPVFPATGTGALLSQRKENGTMHHHSHKDKNTTQGILSSNRSLFEQIKLPPNDSANSDRIAASKQIQVHVIEDDDDWDTPLSGIRPPNRESLLATGNTGNISATEATGGAPAANLVPCPVCNTMVPAVGINGHLDVCLVE